MGVLTSRYRSGGACLRRCRRWKEKTEMVFLVEEHILSEARTQIKRPKLQIIYKKIKIAFSLITKILNQIIVMIILNKLFEKKNSYVILKQACKKVWSANS